MTDMTVFVVFERKILVHPVADTEVAGGFGGVVPDGDLLTGEEGVFVGVIFDFVNTCVHDDLCPVAFVGVHVPSAVVITVG
jgi:hypothetical protein